MCACACARARSPDEKRAFVGWCVFLQRKVGCILQSEPPPPNSSFTFSPFGHPVIYIGAELGGSGVSCGTGRCTEDPDRDPDPDPCSSSSSRAALLNRSGVALSWITLRIVWDCVSCTAEGVIFELAAFSPPRNRSAMVGWTFPRCRHRVYARRGDMAPRWQPAWARTGLQLPSDSDLSRY